MTVPLITLSSGQVEAVIDPGQGADVLSLVDRRSGTDVLFRTPWRDRADGIRAGRPAANYDPVAGWFERYRGGWQTLCPNAGYPRTIHGAPVGFHGEAASVAWNASQVGDDRAQLNVELFSVPVRIERTIELDGNTLRIRDLLTNLSDTELEFDYSQHPALGGDFLAGRCRIETGASRFVADPDAPALMAPGSVHEWPHAVTSDGTPVDLREVPQPESRRTLFGWLEDFDDAGASVTNLDLGLTVRLDRDRYQLPYAWFWQELNASEDFPWYRRARALAIEPASTQTSGPARRSVLRLGPLASTEMFINVGIGNGK